MKLAIETLGSGPNLVLVHGWAMSGGVWAEVAHALSKDYRVHLIDLPGHGATPWSDRARRLSALAGIVAAAVPAGAAWLGWSLGGLVALRAALDRPEAVDRLVLVATTPRFVRGPGWEAAMEPQTLGSFVLGVERDSAATLRRFLALQVCGGERAGATLRRLSQAAGHPDRQALLAGLEILRTTDLRQGLGLVRQPALVVGGDHDALVPAAALRALGAGLFKGQTAIIRGAAHAPFLSHSDAFNETVRGYLCD